MKNDDIGRVDETAVADRLAIAEILALHSRGIDRASVEDLRAAYWPDAEVDYGGFKGLAHEFAAMVGSALDASYELTQHAVSNSLMALSGDDARVESCVTAYHLLHGAAEEMVFSGRYLDRLQRRDGRWKLLHRQVVIDWARRNAVDDERQSEGFAPLARGSRDTSDPLYSFLAS